MVWSGSWVAERLGVELVGDAELRELLGLALRRNPKRAHLLVSHVLGKHVPQYPSVVYGAGFQLGRRVRELLGEAGARHAVVLGYAETATGLGHAVADGLGTAPYLHSTRRPVAGVARAGGFEESHSHATSHLLLPEDPDLLTGDAGDVVGAGVRVTPVLVTPVLMGLRIRPTRPVRTWPTRPVRTRSPPTRCSCWSMTSSPPATPSSTPSAPCTSATPATAT